MRMIRQCGVYLFCASALFAQEARTARESPFQAIPPAPIAADTLAFSASVPNFEARDLNGRTWRSADLRDKVTVIEIWGVYCFPCREEHPMLQDFFNRMRSMNNVQVLTFCLDTNPDRVLSYMKKRGYTFPVIVDTDLETKLFPREGGTPQTWVIGPNGRRTDFFKSWTFGRILLEVEKMAAAR